MQTSFSIILSWKRTAGSPLAVVFIRRICPSSSHCTASSHLFKRVLLRTLRDLSGIRACRIYEKKRALDDTYNVDSNSIRIQFECKSRFVIDTRVYIFRSRFDPSKESLARLYCERFRLIRLLAGSTVTADFHRFSASPRQIMHLSREYTYTRARARARMQSSEAKEFGRERGARGKAE